MKIPSASRLILGLALFLVIQSAGQVSASADVRVNVRAVTFSGKILVDREVRTGTTTVPTKARATCLGGTPADGSKKIEGPTALGALHDAASQTRPRQPLLLSNAFDFGLGVCGVGDSVASGEQWWELTVNHKPSMLGGEGTKLKAGDDVLWFLSRTYNSPSPDELKLVAPETTNSNGWARVRVFVYNDLGRRTPAEGAELNVDSAPPANAEGYIRLRLDRATRLVARQPGFIPSNRAMIRVPG
jgi:hypothetical protein